jgi:hypothetical protein
VTAGVILMLPGSMPVFIARSDRAQGQDGFCMRGWVYLLDITVAGENKGASLPLFKVRG